MLRIPKFPKSFQEPFTITSPPTPIYNCIAWAYEDDTKWYWPDPSGHYYWPQEILREESLDAFVQLFTLIGFQVCQDGEIEAGYKKIAIYVDNDGIPTHAARQLANGLWSSKLGQNFDVSHTIFSMSDGEYGNVAVFMSKRNEE